MKGIYEQMRENEEEARKNPPKPMTWEEMIDFLQKTHENFRCRPYIIYCNEAMMKIFNKAL